MYREIKVKTAYNREGIDWNNRPKKQEITQFQLARIKTQIPNPFSINSITGPNLQGHVHQFRQTFGYDAHINVAEVDRGAFEVIQRQHFKYNYMMRRVNTGTHLRDLLTMTPAQLIDFDATKTLPSLKTSIMKLLKDQSTIQGPKALIVTIAQRNDNMTKTERVMELTKILENSLKAEFRLTSFNKRTNGNIATLKYCTNNKIQLLDLISYKDGGCPMMTMTLVYN